MNDPATCAHKNFRAAVNVGRMEDTGRFIADVTVACTECDLPFEFVGIPAGVRWDGPACSVDGTELRVPIEPQYQVRLRPTATFHVPPELTDRKH